MYCPQCGIESSTGQQYCRTCGANLKVIGKAVSLSEAIARSDRGPLPKIKEMMKNLKLEHVTEEVSHALDQMNTEIVRSSDDVKPPKPWWLEGRKQKTPAERRENHIVKGTMTMFSGAGFMVFMYYLASALVLKLPPDVIANAPFEIDPLVRIVWLVGLIPVMSGLGRIIAGLAIRTHKSGELSEQPPQVAERPPLRAKGERDLYEPPASVTDRTTNILHHAARARGTSEIEK